MTDCEKIFENGTVDTKLNEVARALLKSALDNPKKHLSAIQGVRNRREIGAEQRIAFYLQDFHDSCGTVDKLMGFRQKDDQTGVGSLTAQAAAVCEAADLVCLFPGHYEALKERIKAFVCKTYNEGLDKYIQDRGAFGGIPQYSGANGDKKINFILHILEHTGFGDACS